MSHSKSPLLEQTLADLATQHAGASRVFLRHGMDFCCGGRRSLADVCARDGLDAETLVQELTQEIGPGGDPSFERWDARPLPDLIEHVVQHFHAAHREEVPQLIALARKVESVHADKPTCPRGLADHLDLMHDELENHMQKEEQILFPMIQAGRGSLATMPVQVLEQEHRDHGRSLARLRQLAGDFVPPAEACTTWKALLLRLEQLEADLMLHIHLENNVLFPRALRSQHHVDA